MPAQNKSVTPLVLIVEDDRALQATIAEVVMNAGYRIDLASDGIAASKRLREIVPSIVLLDIGLPFIDGWEILEHMEGVKQPSIIVISARGDENDRIRALDMGADDYLTKPFSSGELLARIRAVLRRMNRESTTSAIVAVNNITVDLKKKCVWRDGIELRLSPTEWVLLVEFAEHPGETLDQRSLLSKVWGSQYVGDRNYLRTFILRLRRKLEVDPSHPLTIETVGRTGYRFGHPS